MLNIPIQSTIPKMPMSLKFVENSLKYIGSLEDLKKRGHPGDICTYQGQQYVYDSTEWTLLEYIPNTPKKILPMFCTQCGASLHSNICEYCGTEYQVK